MRKILPHLLTLMLLVGCQPSMDTSFDANRNDYAQSEQEPASAATPETRSTQNQSVAWVAASPQDGDRQFIRTVDLKFKVKNVTQATYAIEAITRAHGGFIETSSLENSVNSHTTTQISADSTLEMTTYSTSCAMTLRVPADRLDSTLISITDYATFMDYRKIATKDISFDIKALQLASLRYKKYESLIVNKAATKEGSTSDVLENAKIADDAVIAKLRVADKVLMSTITVNIYQTQCVEQNVVASFTPKPYEPSFGSQVVESLEIGLHVAQLIILGLIQIWWLFVLAGITIFAVTYLKRRRKAKKQ